jgi:WD40 repeat protein
LVCELDNTGQGIPIHSNRVFASKFDREDDNMLISGGWDNNIKIWDLREGGPVRNIFGAYVCGDALDIHEGYILSGSWRSEEQL